MLITQTVLFVGFVIVTIMAISVARPVTGDNTLRT